MMITVKKSLKIAGICGIGLTLIIISYVMLENESDVSSDSFPRPETIDRNVSPSIASGPLTILNSKFKLGENVFLTVRDLQKNEAGRILVFSPKGKLFQAYHFNGTQKSDFNAYFKPDTTRTLGICTPEDLMGNWTVVLEGTNYKNVQFEMLPEFLRGGEADIKPVC